jgi:hypothetical protein
VSENIQTELVSRHKAASTTVLGLIVATILLSIVAYLGKSYFRQESNALLSGALLITILIFGLGAVAWRRTKFATMRLQDIAALAGPSGLMKTLEKTTLQVAMLGAAIALLGFAGTLMTGDESFSFRAGVVAIGVLLYAYPTLTSWQRALRQFTSDYATVSPPPPPKFE